VRIRAAQTAVFHLGWLLQVNLERLAATASTPSAVVVRSPHTWQVLRLYREPHVSTALVPQGSDQVRNRSHLVHLR
jgi:hypothetical protein